MREHMTFLLWFAALGAIVYVVYAKWANAPAHTDPAIPIPYSNKEAKTLLLDVPVSSNKSIPPIDANAPTNVETATFALG